MPLAALVNDPQSWNAFVCAHPHSHLLQMWEWGAFKAQFGWRPLRLALLDDKQVGAPMLAASQLLIRSFPLRLGAMGYLPKGPVLAPDSPFWPDWLNALHETARAERLTFIRIEPEWEKESLQTQIPMTAPGIHLQSPAPNIQPQATIHIDLRPAPEAILAQMKPKWRYNIRLAERKGIHVRLGGEADLAEFHRLSQITAQRDGFAIHTEAYYRAMWQRFQPDHTALFVAEFEGKALAAIIVACCNAMAIYLYGASSDEERQRMPNHLLQWHAMLWAKARGCAVYDLWGIPDVAADARDHEDQGSAQPSETLPPSDQAKEGEQSLRTEAPVAQKLPIGLLRFKEGFGGRIVRYADAFDIVYQPLWYRVAMWAMQRRRGGIQ